MFELAKRLMAVLWVADLPAEERLERARLLAKELAAGAAVAEGRVDEFLRACPGHFELVVKLSPCAGSTTGTDFPKKGDAQDALERLVPQGCR